MTRVAIEQGDDEGLAGDVLVRESKKHRRWRYSMELPLNGSELVKLWQFVAAHLEGPRRSKACPLALKAWKQMPRHVRAVRKDRTGLEALPSKMPEVRVDTFYDVGRVDWTRTYVSLVDDEGRT